MTRLALIGGDRQTAQDYAQAAARIRHAQFAAVAHPDTVIRQNAADTLVVAATASSAEALLDRHAAEFDAVLIHGSLPDRGADACRAAVAGKHVLLAAPMASSLREAEQIMAVCQQSGVRLMVGHTARFRPSLVAVRQSLDRGNLGDPSLLRIHAWDSDSGIVSDTGQALAGNQRTTESWPRLTEQLDLALWLFGRWPTEIFALGRKEGGTASTGWPQHLQIHLGFDHGGMALISVAFTALPAGETYNMVSLIGSTGAAYADDFHQTQLLYRRGSATALKTTEGIFAVTGQLREFVESVAQNREPVVSGAAGISAIRLTDLVRQALADGQPVHPDGRNHVSRC